MSTNQRTDSLGDWSGSAAADGLSAWAGGTEGQQTVVAIAGELDAGVATQLSRLFECSVAVDPWSVIIDLEHLEFLDAGGIAVFESLGLRHTRQKHTLSLRKPQPIVRRVITIAGLLQLTESSHVTNARDPVMKATSRHVP